MRIFRFEYILIIDKVFQHCFFLSLRLFARSEDVEVNDQHGSSFI